MFTISNYQLNDCYIGIQLKAEPFTSKEKQVRVNSDTELHISNVVVDFGNVPHEG